MIINNDSEKKKEEKKRAHRSKHISEEVHERLSVMISEDAAPSVLQHSTPKCAIYTHFLVVVIFPFEKRQLRRQASQIAFDADLLNVKILTHNNFP